MRKQKIEPLGGINKDIAPLKLDSRDAVSIVNGRALRPVDGSFGELASIEGVAQADGNSLDWSDHTTLGADYDPVNKLVIQVVYSQSEGSKIVVYDIPNNTNTIVPTAQLGLNSFALINDIHYFNDYLYFLVDGREPRSINIPKLIAGEYPAIPKEEDFTLMRRPPIRRIEVSKGYDPQYGTNTISLSTWRFAYRYYYFNNQYTTLSVHSEPVERIPENWPVKHNFISLQITLSEEIRETVQSISIVAINTTSNYAFEIKRYYRSSPDDLAEINSPPIDLVFTGQSTGVVIPEAEVVSPSDFVPVAPAAMQVMAARIFLDLMQ